MKKISTIALALLLLLSSCGGAETETETVAGEKTVTETVVETEPLTEMEKRALIQDDLPDKSFGGMSFRISTKQGTLYEIDAEELTGDLLNDALYDRNLRIEERFDTEIVPIITEAGDGQTHVNSVKQSILAADDTFDLAATYVFTTGPIITEGYYLNWLNMPYNDMSSPWWLDGINGNLQVGDALYVSVGDMCVSTLKLTYGIFYNRTRGMDYGITDTIYDTVMNGEWTLDYMMSTIGDIYEDTNGDGARDSDDFYGFTAENATNLDIYTFAFDIPIVRQNAEGMPEIVYQSEKTISAIEKINRLYWETTGAYIPEGDYSLPIAMFKDGKALFTTTYLGNAFSEYRDMEDDYSILPYPKWDENQAKYMTGAMDNYSVLGVPITVTDTEMVSILTEALNVESYKTLFPTYYEQALQSKYSRDQESIEMINLLMEGRNFEFSTLFTSDLNYLSTLFRDVINGKSADFASKFAAKEKAANEGLKKVLEAYEKNAAN